MSHVDDGTLNALLDGELDAAETARVQGHIAACAECTRRLEEARRFLAQASDLLGAIEMPKPAAAPAPRRVTATAKEVALDFDGATQQAPAIGAEPPERLFRRAPHPPHERRPFDYTSLAWAATIVLAVGVGYLANEVRHARQTAAPVGETEGRPLRAAPTNAAGVPAAEKAAPDARVAEAPSGAAGKRLSGTERPAGPPAAKAPPGQQKPVVPGRAATGLGHKRLEAAQVALGGARAAAARPARVVDAVAAPQPAAPAGALQNAPAARPAQPVAAPASAGAAGLSETAAAGGAPRLAAAADRDAARDTARVATLEAAVTRLRGAIRLIDGMHSTRVELVPGRLVPYADTAREVVRIVYGEPGTELTLDQQRSGPADRALAAERRARGAPSLGAGSEIMSTSNGAHRLTWSDDDGFWLSLAGHVPADSLRALATRVR